VITRFSFLAQKANDDLPSGHRFERGSQLLSGLAEALGHYKNRCSDLEVKCADLENKNAHLDVRAQAGNG